HTLRWALPLAIAAVVLIYQLVFAAYAHDHFGHTAHTLLELVFYGVVGPVVSWATLTQISRWLAEKEQAEQAARAHERLLATIVDASADAILSLDTDGAIRSWNQGATELFGYPSSQMIGRRLDDLLVRTARRERGVRTNGRARQAPRHYEAVARRANGEEIPVDVTQTPLPDDLGRPAGASVILRDVSERKAREAALAEERARIARDLHDGLAQSLYFMGLKLDFVRKQVHRDPALAEQELSALKQTIQTNIRNVRRTIFALRPIDLEGLGFQAAVEKYAKEFGEQTALGITVRWEGEVSRIPPAWEPQLFRILQEALNNIAKHAQAHTAEIFLAVDEHGRVQAVIRDDGVGFEPTAIPPAAGEGRMGLRQMQERVQALNGRVHVESAPGQGTTLRVEIPLPASFPEPSGR
ncbi:MAG: PAS domain S-box protein, partial [Caldilineae bacterium]